MVSNLRYMVSKWGGIFHARPGAALRVNVALSGTVHIVVVAVARRLAVWDRFTDDT